MVMTTAKTHRQMTNRKYTTTDTYYIILDYITDIALAHAKISRKIEISTTRKTVTP